VFLPDGNTSLPKIAFSIESEQVARRAAKAGLLYVDLIENWITRHRCGKGFTYRGSTGKRLRGERALHRIESLVIHLLGKERRFAPGRMDTSRRSERMMLDGDNTFITHAGKPSVQRPSSIGCCSLVSAFQGSGGVSDAT